MSPSLSQSSVSCPFHLRDLPTYELVVTTCSACHGEHLYQITKHYPQARHNLGVASHPHPKGTAKGGLPVSYPRIHPALLRPLEPLAPQGTLSQ